jgi:multiple sugar transport system ATP-binding protein
MARVTFDQVTKKFGRRIALDSVALEIEDKETFFILGPPKSGKSTLLRCLLGEVTPTAGRVLIDGRDVTALAPAERAVFDLSARPDPHALRADTTAYEYMAFDLQRCGVAARELKEMIDDIAQRLQIEHLLQERIAGLPRTRVERGLVDAGRLEAIGRIANALVVDEPLAKMNGRLHDSAVRQLQRELPSYGYTLLYATSRAEEITSTARVAILNAGVVQQVGTLENICEKPNNSFVAGLVEATCKSGERGVA